LNAGCRVTSIQKFLGHKKLNTTIIYARVYAQTVTNDYYTAMNQVEKMLELIDELKIIHGYIDITVQSTLGIRKSAS
jgi:site-specific recombinase XerD